ncbi:hypothetical protein QJQ45_023024, partial [Haematococcus lacustris]
GEVGVPFGSALWECHRPLGVPFGSAINARRATERWLAPIKPHLQHLAAASSAGTSLVANLKHITVTLATWDAVWEVYLDQKWAEQRLRLYGAQDRTLEQFFKKLEEEMAEVAMQRHGRAKQLVVFFCAASIGTRGGWGADAVLRACCKVVCRPRGTDQRRGRVVLVDEHRTTRLGASSVTRQAGRQAGRQAATQAAASEPGPSTPLPAKRSKRTKAEPEAAEPSQPTKGKGKPAPQPGRWQDRDCNAALNMQRIGLSRLRMLPASAQPIASVKATNDSIAQDRISVEEKQEEEEAKAEDIRGDAGISSGGGDGDCRSRSGAPSVVNRRNGLASQPTETEFSPSGMFAFSNLDNALQHQPQFSADASRGAGTEEDEEDEEPDMRPADLLLDMLTQLLEGHRPEMEDVVKLRGVLRDSLAGSRPELLFQPLPQRLQMDTLLMDKEVEQDLLGRVLGQKLPSSHKTPGTSMSQLRPSSPHTWAGGGNSSSSTVSMPRQTLSGQQGSGLPDIREETDSMDTLTSPRQTPAG